MAHILVLSLLVLLSTVAAAVAATETVVEDSVVPAPQTPYGISKREMELLALSEGARTGVKPVILRPPLVYGPGMKGNPLRLMLLVARGWPIPVSTPAARRSVLYVGNLVYAIRRVLVIPALEPGPYFLSDGPSPTILEFVESMAAALKVRARIIRVPGRMLEAAGRIGDLFARAVPFPVTSDQVRRLTGSVEVDGSRFWRAVGGGVPYSLSEGMNATAAWFGSAASSVASR